MPTILSLTTDAILALLAKKSSVATRFMTQMYYGPTGPRSVINTGQNTLSVVPFWVSEQTTFDRIGVNITVAAATGGVARLGIYNDNGFGVPASLALDAGTVATVTPGAKEIIISKTLSPGLYWLAEVSQGVATGAQMVCMNGAPVIGNAGANLSLATAQSAAVGHMQFNVTGTLPATFVSSSTSATPIVVALRAA